MSKKDPGFFTMQDAVAVLKQPDLPAAKAFLSAKAADYVAAHPQTRKDNIVKVEGMIAKSISLEKLSFAVANFVLAHTSENLKVIR